MALETIDKKTIAFSDKSAVQIATVEGHANGLALDIRLMYPDNVNQEWRPTKKGAFMVVTKEQAKEIADAVQSMVENFE